jgi:hypothetical protein
MRIKVLVFAVSALLISNPSAGIPQTPAATTSSSQAATLLSQAAAALTGSTLVNDVTLKGTVERIAGSDDEFGTAILKAVSNGSSRLDFTFPSGTSSEVCNLFAAPVGMWSGPDGLSYGLAFHNLLTEPAWFSPSVAVQRRVSPGFISSYVGHESLNGRGVEHVSVSQSAPFPDPPGSPTHTHLSQVDFYLDSITLLPAIISFNIHPKNDAFLDFPVQILLSDYRSVSGVQTAFHVQKFLNNSLVLDLQFQSASINSGLPTNSFEVIAVF